MRSEASFGFFTGGRGAEIDASSFSRPEINLSMV